MFLKEYYDSCGSYGTFVDRVEEQIQLIIEEDVDFVYPDKSGDFCSYSFGPNGNREKTCGCLFGRAFQNLGINVEDLEGDIQEALEFHGIKCPQKWIFLQRAQDNGVFYGNLIKFYEEIKKLFKYED